MANDSGSRRFSIEWGDNHRVDFNDHGVQVSLGDGVDSMSRREIAEGMVAGLEGHLAGMLVLHASSVAWGNSIVALMGDQGAGKSSLSFACARAAGCMISDGMTVVEPESLLVRTGLRRWKLADESLQHFELDPAEYDFVNEACVKRYVPFSGRAPNEAAKLRTVFWVTAGDSERIELLEPREQLLGLVTNAYLVSEFPVTEQQQLLIRAARALGAGVVVKRLVRRKTWDAMAEAVRLVRSEVCQGSPHE